MTHQNCLRFYDEIAYDPVFNGLVLDENEGARLASLMNGKRVLLHQNHGVIICGNSVAEAFDDVYYLERACQVQILAQSTGKPLAIVDDAARAQVQARLRGGQRHGQLGQPALGGAQAEAHARAGEHILHVAAFAKT